MTAVENSLRISIPVANADDIGLRPLSSPARIAELVDILKAPSPPPTAQWARRLKDYQARLASRSVGESCFVIREIIRSGPRPAASAEGMLLRNARASLAMEFSLALDISEEHAMNMMDAAATESAGDAIA